MRSPFVQTVLHYFQDVLFYDVCAGSVCDVAKAACNTHPSPADVGLVMGAESVRPVFAEMAAAQGSPGATA